jgi:hypothetical protein
MPSNHSALKISIAASFAFATSALGAPPTSSSYNTDPQYTYVEDATSKGIGQVNMITCIMSSMRPDQLVNKGDYLALVDENKCDPQQRSSSSNSGGDSSQAATYTTATVNSARATNSDPMRMKAWLDEDQDGTATTIFINANISEAATDTNPYGVFRLDFCGRINDQFSLGCLMHGFLQGSSGSLSYFQNEARDGDGESTVALHLTSVGTTSGSGKLSIVRTENSQTDSQEFLFSYDHDHFLRGDQCFSRDASDPATGQSVWRYGLYNASTGAHVDLNSGFPIDYVSSGTTYHGYLGYGGLSLPQNVLDAMPSGATVQKVDYNSGSDPTRTAYTVVKSGGRLTKYTKLTRTLHQIDKIKFSTFINDASSFYSGAQSFTSYAMYWDDANQVVKVTGKMVCGQNGCQTQDLPQEESVSLSFWASQGGISSYSDALAGELFIDLHSVPTPFDSNAIMVAYRKQDLVYPAQMPATLYCLNNCPTTASIANFFQQGSQATSPFVDATYNSWMPTTTTITYTGDATNAVINDESGHAPVASDRQAFQSNQNPAYQYGLRSGRMFTDLQAAQCPGNPNTLCDSQVGSMDVYYVWETGPNSWNQFAAVKDAQGTIVAFDAPLQVTFNVPNDAVRYKTYAGKSLVLQYGGFGQLGGIPGSCVSQLTNQPVSCDTEDSRYVPDFVIPFDATVGQVSSGNTTYLVKWLEREIRFASKSLSECSTLTLPANTTLPTLSDLKDPSDPASDIYVGTKPAVTTAPRVVQGEVKY